jgi:translation initiation factor 3 subunit D
MTAEEFPIVPLRTDGWGPTSVPSGFESLPYTPFSKSDRISKIADWTNPSSSGGQQYSHDQQQQQQQEDSYGRNRRRFGVPTEAFGTGMNSLFSYQIAADDEANFSTVDRATAPRSKVRGGGGPAKSVSWSTSGRAGRGEGFVSKRRMFGRGGMHREARVRDPSIKVGAHWSLIEEMDFPRLSKLYYDVQNPEDLYAFLHVLSNLWVPWACLERILLDSEVMTLIPLWT